jgi:hypothetical protein
LYDELVKPSYRANLQARSLAELRSMRGECEHAEAAVSFTRRVLHGRLDVIAAEQLRRIDAADVTPTTGGAPDEPAGSLAALIGRLPAQLADQPAPGAARANRLLLTPPPDCVQHDLMELVDDVVGPATLSTLGDVSDTGLVDLVAGLGAVERELSGVRRDLHVAIDALQEEITHRYQRGEASLDGLFA